MEQEMNELDELAQEIRKVINDNKNFLSKIMDEDFEPEEDDVLDPPPIEL